MQQFAKQRVGVLTTGAQVGKAGAKQEVEESFFSLTHTNYREWTLVVLDVKILQARWDLNPQSPDLEADSIRYTEDLYI